MLFSVGVAGGVAGGIAGEKVEVQGNFEPLSAPLFAPQIRQVECEEREVDSQFSATTGSGEANLPTTCVGPVSA
jgi:hypothetical protein